MTSHSHWLLLHVLSIGSHAGMIIAGFVAFIYLGVTSNGRANFDPKFETSIILSWASAGVGMLGLLFNSLLFTALTRLQKEQLDSTEESRYLKKKLVFGIGIVLGLLVCSADVGFAAVLRHRIHKYEVIVGPFALAAISGVFMFVTVCADIRMFIEERKDFRAVMGYNDDTTPAHDGEIALD